MWRAGIAAVCLVGCSTSTATPPAQDASVPRDAGADVVAVDAGVDALVPYDAGCGPARCATAPGWSCVGDCDAGISPECASACGAGEIAIAAPGTYELRAPPTSGPDGACAAACADAGASAPLWAMRVRVPGDQVYCVEVDGPDPMYFDHGSVGPLNTFPICSGSSANGCATAVTTPGPRLDQYVVVGLVAPAERGAVFRLTVGDCDGGAGMLTCDPTSQGCNGNGPDAGP